MFAFMSATWSEARRREMCFSPDRLLSQLLERRDVRRLLVVDAPRSAPARAVRQALGDGELPFPGDDATKLYRPLRLRRKNPRSPAAIRRYYRRYGRRLGSTAAREGLERPLVIATDPFIAGFSPLEWAGRVVFYGWDDWAAHPRFERWWPAYEEAYAAIRARGCEVWAVSQAIVDRIAPVGGGSVVPNGVDPDEWSEPAPPPSWLEALPRPRVLYAGTLDTRVDVSGVRRIADELPGGSVALVGRVADPPHFASLRGVRNVVFPGEVPRRQIPSLVAAADVCLLPHVRTPLTEAMSPLKLYEYLAAGRPVVASDLPPIRGVEGPVILAGEGDDLADAVRRALDLGPAPEKERQEFLRSNSWERRFGPLLDAVLDADKDPRP